MADPGSSDRFSHLELSPDLQERYVSSPRNPALSFGRLPEWSKSKESDAGNRRDLHVSGWTSTESDSDGGDPLSDSPSLSWLNRSNSVEADVGANETTDRFNKLRDRVARQLFKSDGEFSDEEEAVQHISSSISRVHMADVREDSNTRVENASLSSEDDGRSVGNARPSRSLPQYSEELSGAPECQIGGDIQRIVARLCSISSHTRRIMHDVLVIPSERERSRVSEYIKLIPDRNFKNKILMFVDHPVENFNHIHFIHDCLWHNSTCKCAVSTFLQPFIKRRNKKNGKWSGQCDEQYWRNLLLYLSQEEGGYSWLLLQVDGQFGSSVLSSIVGHSNCGPNCSKRGRLEGSGMEGEHCNISSGSNIPSNLKQRILDNLKYTYTYKSSRPNNFLF